MDFMLITANTFGLAAFMAIWLSITFVSFGIYKSEKNINFAISLARIASRMQYILLAWFLLLGIAYSQADNYIWVFVYTFFFAGLVLIIRKMYGDILRAVYSIKKDDGSNAKRLIAQKAVAKIDAPYFNRVKSTGFNRFKLFFFAIDATISIGAVLNFVLHDTDGASIMEVIIANTALVIAIQIILLPIYYVVRSVVFATVPKND